MKNVYVWLCIALLLGAIGCDERTLPKPTMAVNLENDTVYSLNNFNTTDVEVIIEGDYPELYTNVRINLTYDATRLFILQTSSPYSTSQFSLRTNNEGIAIAQIAAISGSDDTINPVPIVFKLADYNIEQTKFVHIEKPYIESISATPDLVLPNGTDVSTITVVTTPQASNLNVVFSCNSTAPTFTSQTVSTVANGVATNYIKSNITGTFEITASLAINPDQSKTTRVHFYNH